MTDALSPNTKAILLLTAPLITGRGKKPGDLLTPGEYKKLAKHLIGLEAKPADLLTSAADQLLGDSHRVIDKARLERLLARGFLLSQAIERWQARAIWVVSRADGTYPQRLKARLREDSPAVLYGCGDRKILDSGGLAVVGSRNVDDVLIEYTRDIGRLAASAGRTLVSGGARGIDQAAMRGALEGGGRVTGVLGDSLERAAMQREHRNMLLEEQLVLISPYDPSAGFNVGHAMQRNKLIYALADAALVVSADLDKGGTWAGATEQLEGLHLVPVFVRRAEGGCPGLDGLAKKGALPWPDPVDADGLNAVIATPTPERTSWPAQSQLSFASPQPTAVANSPGDPPELTVADELFGIVRSVVFRVVREPMQAAEVAQCLGVTDAQAQTWLERLVEEGVLEKSKQPVHYSIRQTSLPGTKSASGPRATTKRAGSGK
jgi:predicted Rossmann fold nucleotide-binding protein DprA/Smf involved in DNA uptake